MGNSFSYLEAEKQRWIDHTLLFDQNARSENIPKLSKITNGTEIYLTYTVRDFRKFKYQHWFVTDGYHLIGFGIPSENIYNTFVSINSEQFNYRLNEKRNSRRETMDDSIRDRIKHVLGMNNYSLCLRNSEHVANYILHGRWISSQLDSERRPMMKYFLPEMKQDYRHVKLVNTFPFCMLSQVCQRNNEKLYTFLDGYYKATGFQYYLDHEEDTYNILVIGPTGCGKSHLINVMFNQHLCKSDVSHHSVTRDMYFIRGKGNIFDMRRNEYTERDIVVADTIGLCDTEWDDAFILNLIKGRISSNFKRIHAVFIVFKADRLLKDQVKSIKAVLRWFDFKKNYLRVNFICTFAEYLNSEQKNALREEALRLLNLKNYVESRTYISIAYTGFSPENTLNDNTRNAIRENYESLHNILTGSTFISPPITIQFDKKPLFPNCFG